MKNKNRYLLIGMSLWALISLLLKSYIASVEESNVNVGPIVINLMIASFLLKSKWLRCKYIDVSDTKTQLIGIGFGTSFVIFIIQCIFGAIVFSQL